MRRYADTFFRYWTLALLPIVVLPLASLVLVRTAPTVYGSANIWVDQISLKQLSYVDPTLTPAVNMSNYFGQLLLSRSFDLGVVKRSPLYQHLLATQPYPNDVAVSDLSKSAQVTAGGPSLVSIAYVGKSAPVAVEVVRGILAEASYEIQLLKTRQSLKDIAYYTAQLTSARARYGANAKSLGIYLADHGITATDLALKQLSDPKLAALYQAVQSAQTDVTNATQQLSTARTADSAQASFRVQDAPSAKVTVISRTKKLMGLAIPLVLALLLSSAFIVIKTVLDRTVRYADEVPELLGLPVLTIVPYRRVAPVGGGHRVKSTEPASLVRPPWSKREA